MILSGQDYVQDLLAWNFAPSQGWGYGYSYKRGKKKKRLFPPLDHTGTHFLEKGEPIYFRRTFDGFEVGRETYFELSQKLCHILEIHWVSSRKAYCKLDVVGDLKSIVEVSNNDEGTIVSIDFDELEFYMFLTDTVLIRMFDNTRFNDQDWSNPQIQDQVTYKGMSEIFAKRVIVSPEQGYLRGFEIIQRRTPNDVLLRVIDGKPKQPKKYADFIVVDWKHETVAECSCDPDQLGNYFVESDLPFSTSPAFFKPEVMLRYKQNPNKYEIENRSINCRGTWFLRYDINQEGQVHVYLCDLGDLPYEEQIYWKAFNEGPKGGISSRAYKTDFLAEWDIDYDPLDSLKQTLDHFPFANQFNLKRPIWEKPDGANSFSRLAYVVTDSKKEWEDQVLELAKLIVDRFRKKELRKLAAAIGCDDPTLGSLKLLRICLENLGVESEIVSEIGDPLQTLWYLRSSGIAHFGDAAPEVDLKEHYRQLLSSIDNSMKRLAEFIERNYFDITQDGESQYIESIGKK
jgi:hypothetical protein